MGVKIRKRGGKWYVFVNYRGRRKAKCVGSSREAAEQVRRQGHPRNIRGGNEVAVGVDGDLNRAVAHLILHVCRRSAVLDQKASERVAEVMKSKSTQTRMLQAREELIVGQVAMVEDRSPLRREYEILRN